LLEQTTALDYPNFEILLVDNASTDGSCEAVSEAFPQVKILKNADNLGAAGGFNSGLKWALQYEAYQYIWLLDNDVEIAPESLKLLVEALQNQPSAGLAGPMVLNIDYPDLIMEVGGVILWDSASSIGLGKGEDKAAWENHPAFSVDYLPGGCGMLISTLALRQAGILDEGYYFLWEDIDFGLNFKCRGFEALAVPQAKVYHKDITLVRNSPRHRYYSTRNNLRFFFAHSQNSTGKIKSLTRAFSAYLMFSAWGLKDYAQAIRQGIRDFMGGKTGKVEYDFTVSHHPSPPITLNQLKEKKILFFPNSQKDLELIKELSQTNLVTVAIEEYKAGQFKDCGFEILSFKPLALKSLLATIGRVRRTKYDLLLTCKEVYSPQLGLLNQFYSLVSWQNGHTVSKQPDYFMGIKYLGAFINSYLLSLAVYPFCPQITRASRKTI